MILVSAMAGALWGIGALMRVPRSLRFGMLGLLWLAVISLHVVLPDGHPLRLATGGAPQGWVARVSTRARAWPIGIQARPVPPLPHSSNLL